MIVIIIDIASQEGLSFMELTVSNGFDNCSGAYLQNKYSIASFVASVS